MRKLLVIPIVVLAFATSCKNKNDNNINPGNGSNSQSITQGSWKVSYFYDNDKDETSDYSGYSFVFNVDNSLTATRNANTTNGSWREISDDGFQKLVITLNTTDDKLTELNDDWVIETQTDAEIKLKEDNPDRNEQLHFGR